MPIYSVLFNNRAMEFEFGFDAFPSGSVVVIAEELGSTHRVFAQNVAVAAMRRGEKVVYITTKKREDVLALMDLYRLPHTDDFKVIGDIRDRSFLPKEYESDLSIIDHFALLYSGAALDAIRDEMWSLIDRSRKGRTILIVLDTGILSREAEQMIYALADDVVRLITTAEGSRLKRYISIPKMNGVIPPDQYIPFTLNADGLLIDTRERHG